MTTPDALPHAVFTGAYGDTATNGWYPAQAALEQGYVTLWIAGPSGWAQQFSVPAHQVVVKSAAQRITLVAAGRSYPILADPAAVSRALGLGAAQVVGGMMGNPAAASAGTAGRAMNQVGAARSFAAGGGYEFLAAMRASGGRVSRLGYGGIAAIGCGVALLTGVAVLVVTAWALNL